MDLETLFDTPPWERPGDAVEGVLAVLDDAGADESQRKLAAELAGELMDDELAAAVLAIIGNSGESETVRKAAAIALAPALKHADTFEFDDPDDIMLSEKAFHRVQQSLYRLYLDADVPENVRRSILEASVRAPREWHADAVRGAYASDEEPWKLTAVCCMRFVRGFDEQVVAALDNPNPDIRYQAVCAAGNWAIDGAWQHIMGILGQERADKYLLIAAIDASVSIRPEEAVVEISELTESEDNEIADAAFEALAMAEGLSELEDEDEEDDCYR